MPPVLTLDAEDLVYPAPAVGIQKTRYPSRVLVVPPEVREHAVRGIIRGVWGFPFC